MPRAANGWSIGATTHRRSICEEGLRGRARRGWLLRVSLRVRCSFDSACHGLEEGAVPQLHIGFVADERAYVISCLIEVHLLESAPQKLAQLSGVEFAGILPVVDSGRTLPGIPANVTTESGQPYQRFRGKPSNFGWLPEWVVGMTGMDRRASASLIEQASGSHSSGEGEAMANERISMRKIRDIIRLRGKGLGYRQIGRALRISHPVVSQYARDFAATGLSYAQIAGISDSELMELLAGGRTADARYGALGAWFERCARELKRVGVTIHQIWEEYRQEQPDGYSYSQFCYHFQVWRDGDEVTMHIEHKVGDKLFVDFAGKKLTVSEPHRAVRREVESFVAVLGANLPTTIARSVRRVTREPCAASRTSARNPPGTTCLVAAALPPTQHDPNTRPLSARLLHAPLPAAVPLLVRTRAPQLPRSASQPLEHSPAHSDITQLPVILREPKPAQPRPALHRHPHTRNPIPIGARFSSINPIRPVPGDAGNGQRSLFAGHSSDRLLIIMRAQTEVRPIHNRRRRRYAGPDEPGCRLSPDRAATLPR